MIKCWQLKKLPSADHPFGIYVGIDRAIVITGIGKINMAGAMGYVLALFKKPTPPILINLGIGGQRDEPRGTLCLGHKIIERESGRCFYPQLPFSISCKTYSVITVCQPRNTYMTDELYEMEAAGFYEIAIKFSVSELIQVLKIVSDNALSPICDIDETLVETWVEAQRPVIEELIVQLIALRQLASVQANSVYSEMLETFHFTVSRSLKLKSLLQRWQVLKGGEAMPWREANLKSAKELLAWIERHLNDLDFYL